MSDNSAIKTARRTFEILEFFDEVRKPLSLKEIIDRFDYPVSSASALLKSMVVLGLLDYDRYSRTYMPTMRVATVGAWVKTAMFGEGEILDLMRHLNEVTQETISIGTQSDLFAQYIHAVPSRLPVRFVIKPGDVRSITASGLGWLLLSARRDEDIELLLRRSNLAEKDPARRVALPELMARIHEIRSQGYVVSRHTVVSGGGIVAMLLPERKHGRILAIGVNGPVDRLDARLDFIVEELRTSIHRFVGKDSPHANAALRKVHG